MEKSQLIIHFIKGKKMKKRIYDSIEFLNKKHNIGKEKLTIDIEKSYFNDSKEKIVLDLKVNPFDILSEPLEYKINIFYGINRAYCFLSEINNLLIEYNYIDAQKIYYEDSEIKEYDGNGLVKRVVLINCPMFLKIENKRVTFINSIADFSPNLNSFEFTDFDYQKTLFGVKAIQAEEKFSIINCMKEQKQKLVDLFLELKQIMGKNIGQKEIYEKLFKKYDIKEYPINFSQKKNTLKCEFKTDDDYYLMSLYFIWYSIKYSYLNEKSNCKLSIIDIFNNFNNFYDLYLKDKDLEIYQKILLFYSNVSFFLKINDIKKYELVKLKYIKRKDLKDNSIYKLSFDFIKNFILKLNEKSYLFYPLLMLDCGIYKYNSDNDFIYGYNRESCDVIKSHLDELIPDVFFEYSEKGDETKEERAFNYKGFGIIFLNRLAIFNNLDKELIDKPFKNDNEKKVFKHYGMLTSKTLMHESFGHNKMIFDKKDRTISPSKFFNKNKKLVKMIPVQSYEKSDENIEYFQALNEKCTGESGKFFEYFFGKYNQKKLIIDLIFKIDYIGNLLDNVDYFVKEKLDDLQKYIINKYKLNKSKNIKYDDVNISFEEENEKMEKIITNQEKENKISNKEKIEEIKNDDEQIQNILEPRKDIIFLEEDLSDVEDENKEYKKVKEKEEELPFYISLYRP